MTVIPLSWIDEYLLSGALCTLAALRIDNEFACKVMWAVTGTMPSDGTPERPGRYYRMKQSDLVTDPRTGGWSRAAAALAVTAVLGASAVLGRRNAPDRSHPGIRRWYRSLDKPGFTPPDAAFGAVWPVLETGLAVGGYRLLRRPSDLARDAAVGLWLLNTAMVGGWTELFFRKHRLGASAAASGAMVASSAAYVAVAARVDRPAAAAAVPFVAWLGFATLLAERIRRDNPATGL